MNTTKRKFNALLNGLGNKKSDSSLSAGAHEVNKIPEKPQPDIDSNMKKPRISYSSSTATANRLSSLTRASSAAVSELDNARRNLSPVAKLSPIPVSTEEPPKWAPYDRTEFLKRLKSFSNLTDWTPKPTRVNEVEWAKRGWVCQKKERVRCCFCNVEILVKLNKKEEDGREKEVYIAENIENALVDKYVELIITSHDESCPWRQRGCDDVIFKLPLNKPAITIQTLRERYNELQQRADHLPYLSNMAPPEGFDIDLITTYLPGDFLRSSPETGQANPPSEINKVALMMSLCGWQGHKHDRLGQQLESVSCQTCYRILGLWMFKSRSVSATGQETEPAIVPGLDPIAQHREYCPWRDPVSQNGLAATHNTKLRALAGWEVVLRVLKTEHGLRVGREKNEKGSRRSYVSPATNEGGEYGDDSTPDFADDEDAKSIRDAKDKDLMTRFRRVKTFIALKKRASGEVKNKRFSAA